MKHNQELIYYFLDLFIKAKIDLYLMRIYI